MKINFFNNVFYKNKKINLDEKPKIFEEENKIENNACIPSGLMIL